MTLFTLVNASGEHKKPQMRSHMTPKVCLPKFGLGQTSASAKLRPISTGHPFMGRYNDY